MRKYLLQFAFLLAAALGALAFGASAQAAGPLTVTLTTDPATTSAQDFPYRPTLVATIGNGDASTVNYTFYCQRTDAEVESPPRAVDSSLQVNYQLAYNRDDKYDVYSGDKQDGVAGTSARSTVCLYTSEGTYTAKVIVEQGSQSAQAQLQIITREPVNPDILVNLTSANPNGVATFNPTLSASFKGKAASDASMAGKPVTYTFYCHRVDVGTDYITVDPAFSVADQIAWLSNHATNNKYAGRQVTVSSGNFVSKEDATCRYTQPGYYLAKVIVQRGTYVGQNQQIIKVVPAPAPEQLEVTLSSSVVAGSTPFQPTLTASVKGSAVQMTGNPPRIANTVNYTFYCLRADGGTDVRPVDETWSVDTQKFYNDIGNYQLYAGQKFDGVGSITVSTAVCKYSSGGTYLAAVVVEAGSAPAATYRLKLTVTQSSTPTLTAAVAAQPTNDSTGTVTHTPTIRASLKGTVLTDPSLASQEIFYTLYCDRTDAGTDTDSVISSPIDSNSNTWNEYSVRNQRQEASINPPSSNPPPPSYRLAKYKAIQFTPNLQTNPDFFDVANFCKYEDPGTYTAKVIIKRGSVVDEARALIRVNSVTPLSFGIYQFTSLAGNSGNITFAPTFRGQTTGAASSKFYEGKPENLSMTFYCDRNDASTDLKVVDSNYQVDAQSREHAVGINRDRYAGTSYVPSRATQLYLDVKPAGCSYTQPDHVYYPKLIASWKDKETGLQYAATRVFSLRTLPAKLFVSLTATDNTVSSPPVLTANILPNTTATGPSTFVFTCRDGIHSAITITVDENTTSASTNQCGPYPPTSGSNQNTALVTVTRGGITSSATISFATGALVPVTPEPVDPGGIGGSVLPYGEGSAAW